LNDGVVQTNRDFEIQYSNVAFKSLTASQEEAWIHGRLSDFVFGDDKQLIKSLIQQFDANREFNPPPVRVRLANAEEPVWVEMKLSCMPETNSEDCAFYVIVKNIHEEIKSEKIIQKLQVAIENSIEGVAIMNDRDQYTYLNKSHIELFGYSSEEEILGKSWRVFYPEAEIERIEKEVFPVFMQQGFFRGPTKGLKKDGSIIYQDISLTSLPDGGLICVTHDITHEIERQKQVTQMALVAEKTNSIVLITDAFGRIEWVNKSFESLTGYSKEEIKGLRPSEFLTGPETDPAMVKEILEIIKEGRHFKGEILNYDRSGKKFWLYIDVTPLRDEEGNLN
jgi:PAS domain S-box-containing protein